MVKDIHDGLALFKELKKYFAARRWFAEIILVNTNKQESQYYEHVAGRLEELAPQFQDIIGDLAADDAHYFQFHKDLSDEIDCYRQIKEKERIIEEFEAEQRPTLGEIIEPGAEFGIYNEMFI